MQREDGMTRHHIIAKYKGGLWHRDNIKPLHHVPHRAWHILFDNDLPIEVLRGFTETVRPTLGKDTYQLINGVLRQVEGTIDAYNPTCYDRERLASYFSRTGKKA